MSECKGMMGKLFGHKWVEYGRLLTRTQLCVYLHHEHPNAERDLIPPRGKFCPRCGAVRGEGYDNPNQR